MPSNAHPADTIIPVDTAVQTSALQFVDSVAASAPGDSVVDSISTRPVMEVPTASKAQPFSRSPMHDTPSMILLLAGLLAVALSYHTGYKYIENFFHYMFSTRRRENLFEDHTVNETSILAALIANTCIVEGFIVYFAVQLIYPPLAATLQASVFQHIAAYCGLALAFYLIQLLVYRVLGYTFTDNLNTKLWVDGFKSSQAFLGLLLLPVLFLLMLYPSIGKLLLAIAAALYLVVRLIFIYKGFRIFYSNLSSILFFILYLCAVEIVPLVIMASVTYWISGIL
ncbi:MAG: DUF4271 domain-containing protein [Muribaculaceae bacterium]|nr:DUF4271 domain-containing protein [Muribaculaceae bacterium]